MTDKMHILEIYDTEDYFGPNPLKLTGQFVIRGPENSQYYVLIPDEPLEVNGCAIDCLAIRPHYDGDSINNVVGSICTVGIAHPHPGETYQEDKAYGFNDFIFWKVGKINPSHHE